MSPRTRSFGSSRQKRTHAVWPTSNGNRRPSASCYTGDICLYQAATCRTRLLARLRYIVFGTLQRYAAVSGQLRASHTDPINSRINGRRTDGRTAAAATVRRLREQMRDFCRSDAEPSWQNVSSGAGWLCSPASVVDRPPTHWRTGRRSAFTDAINNDGSGEAGRRARATNNIVDWRGSCMRPILFSAGRRSLLHRSSDE